MEKTLYAITGELQELQRELVESQGELDEIKEETLAKLTSQLTEKTDNVVDWVNAQESYILEIEERIRLFNELKAQVKKDLDRFKEYVTNCMDRLETTKVNGRFAKISIRKPSMKVNVVNEDDIPIEYWEKRTELKLDKAQLRKDLMEGKEIPGAELEMGKRTPQFKIGG